MIRIVRSPAKLKAKRINGIEDRFHADESLDRLRTFTLDGGNFGADKQVRVEAEVWAFSTIHDRLDLYDSRNANVPVWIPIATLTPGQIGAQTLSATHVLPDGPIQSIRGVFRYGGSATTCSNGPFDDQDDLAFAVTFSGDAISPNTLIFNPPRNAHVRGLTRFDVSPADNVGVVRNELWDGSVMMQVTPVRRTFTGSSSITKKREVLPTSSRAPSLVISNSVVYRCDRPPGLGFHVLEDTEWYRVFARSLRC